MTTYGSGSPSHTIHDSAINDILPYSDAKVKIRSSEFNAIVLISHMWAIKMFTGSRLISHLLLEKSSWNRLTPGGKRTLRYFQDDGRTQNMVFDGAVGSYTDTETELAYEFLATQKNSYPEQISNDASNNADLKIILEDGCEILQSNFARDTNPVIVLQDTLRHINVYTSAYIKPPPKWHIQKHVLGQDLWTLRQEISAGVTYGLRVYAKQSRSYDPKWLPVEFSSSNEAFIKARGYILQGQKIRVKAGSDYHDVIDVMRIGSSVWFVLSPYMAAAGPVAFTPTEDLVVKSIVSLDGTRNKCIHVLESESISSYDVETRVAVDFFIDARLWSKVFSVYSNSRQALLQSSF